MLPKAIVIGCNGQDGSLLCALLHQKDYSVYGIDHTRSDRTQSFVRFSVLNVCDPSRLHDFIAAWPEGSTYLGFIFARAETPEEVEAALRRAHHELRFTITPRLAVAHPAVL